MADTKPKAEEGAEPEEQVEPTEPKGDGEDHRIPKARLDQESAKRKAAEERAAAAEARLKELEVSRKPESKPEPKETDKEVVERLAAIEEREALREIRTEMSLNSEQATAVREVQKANPGLKLPEALAIARSRDLELFGNVDGRGVDLSQHTTVRPRGGGPPPKKTIKESVETIKQIPAELQRNREAARLHGQVVAHVLGWERKETD